VGLGFKKLLTEGRYSSLVAGALVGRPRSGSREVSHLLPQEIFVISSTLKMETTRSSETSICKPTQRYIPEDGILQLKEEFTVVNLKYMYTLLYHKHNEEKVFMCM
jgi:hypothetical protein